MFDIAIVFDIGVIALRIIMPVFAILIVYQCFAAMRRRRRSEKPLVTLCNTQTGSVIPILFWEKSPVCSGSWRCTAVTCRWYPEVWDRISIIPRMCLKTGS